MFNRFNKQGRRLQHEFERAAKAMFTPHLLTLDERIEIREIDERNRQAEVAREIAEEAELEADQRQGWQEMNELHGLDLPYEGHAHRMRLCGALSPCHAHRQARLELSDPTLWDEHERWCIETEAAWREEVVDMERKRGELSW
jgi:hypothetical protein